MFGIFSSFDGNVRLVATSMYEHRENIDFERILKSTLIQDGIEARLYANMVSNTWATANVLQYRPALRTDMATIFLTAET